MAPLINFRNTPRTPEKNLNWGHPLLHIVSSAHEVWLICNYDFRSEEKKQLHENRKAQAPMLFRICFFRAGGGGEE